MRHDWPANKPPGGSAARMAVAEFKESSFAADALRMAVCSVAEAIGSR
jgi:hypothetical protein